ncbi:MAG: hypothetical protein IKN53_06815 [Oscillibacter sp.]|nr:hypothetical protein [Oscillibacter sp.]
MDHRKELLLAAAARLYSLGVDLEGARSRLRELVERGVSYGSAEMAQAYQNFSDLEAQWKALEAEYRDLRGEVLRDEAETK